MKRIYIKDLKNGDIVRIKSQEWYEENKDDYGDVCQEDNVFCSSMSKFCGTDVEISDLKDGDVTFLIKDNDTYFSDWMVEKIVTKNVYKIGYKVRVKSLEWFKDHFTPHGYLDLPDKDLWYVVDEGILDFCGKVVTIRKNYYSKHYYIEEMDHDARWYDFMFENEMTMKMDKKKTDADVVESKDNKDKEIPNSIDLIEEEPKEIEIVNNPLNDCEMESNEDALLSEINDLKEKLIEKEYKLEIIQKEVVDLKNTLKSTNEECSELIEKVKSDLKEKYLTRIERYEKIIDKLLY